MMKKNRKNLKNKNLRLNYFKIALAITIATLLLYIAQLTGFSVYGTTDYGITADISACQNISTSGTYTLTSNVNFSNNNLNACFYITTSHVTLDGNGFTLSNGTVNSYGIYVYRPSSNTNVTIKNFANITGFTSPLRADQVNNLVVYNNTITNLNISDSDDLIDIFSSNSSNITSNTVVLYGLGAGIKGVSLTSSSNDAIISSNTVTSTQGGSPGITVTGNRANIQSNTVTVNGDGITVGGTNGSIISNTINTTDNNAEGIVLSTSAKNITIESNNIRTTGTSAYGVYVGISGVNNTIISNTIITTGSSNSDGVWLDSTLANNYVRSNNIDVLSSNKGIRDDGTGSIMNSNNINVSTGTGISSSTSANITNNTIRVKSSGTGISISGLITGSLNIVNSNTITGNSSSGTGISITRPSNNITSNTITLNGTGISIQNTFNIITLNTVNTSGSGSTAIITQNGAYKADNNTLANNTIISAGIGIDFSSGLGNNITNNVITATGSDIQVNDGTGTILNTTFVKTDISFDSGATGSVHVNWYVLTNVTNATVKVLPNANVTPYNISNLQGNSQTADSNGLTTLSISEFWQNRTVKTYITPHNITATAPGYFMNGSVINISQTNSTSVQLSLAQDLAAPSVTINLPTAKWYNTNFTVNTTVTDTGGVQIVRYRYENTSFNSSWLSMTQSGNSWTATFNASGAGDDNYTFRINATDLGNNSNTTQTISGILVDLTNPSGLTFNTPTLSAGAYNNKNYYEVNFTFTDVNPDTCLLEVSGANITMTRTGTSCFINRTSQSEGFYNYKIWVNDSAGNINVSSERNVTIDLTNPSLSILRPLNNSHIPAGVTFNFTTNDSYLNNATLYINQIANETNSSGNNGTYIITKIIIDGQYNWSVLAYDKAGNSNQSVAYNFSTETDITAPTVSITNPSTGSGITANFLINTTITDSFTVTSVQYRYENTTSNSSWNIMTQNGNFWTATFNITQSGDGNFTIRINATDDSTNSNTTVTTTSIIIDTVNPTITLNSPANNSIQNSATVNINTTITDSFIYNASLIINGANNETNNSRNSGEYVFTKTLIDGTHNWSIIVYDYVNHTVQSATRTFTIDTGIPNVTINSPTTGWKTTPITINTTVNDGIGTVTNVQYRAETITQNYSWQTLTQSGNSWTATFNNTGINDGNYNIRINATDTATNSNTTQIINISLDTTPPTISSTSVNSTNGTTGDSFTITGTISDAGIGVNNSRIFIRNMKNGTVTTLATTPSGNTYTATWNSGANLNTTYLVDIDVNDSLGNYRVLTARHMITLTPVNTTMATYQNNSLNINTGGQAVFSATLNNNSAVYVRLATQTNISNASVLISMYSANIEGGVPTGKTALGKYFHISLDNNTLANISTARINVTYTASEVTDAGLQESSLKIYRWNPGSSSWSVLDSTGVISGNGIIWGNVSSFSSFGVFGDSTSSDSGGGDSGGSSGGGGGGGGGGGTQKNPTPQESTPQESQQEQANIALGGSRSGSEEQYVTTISRGGGGTVLDSTGGGIACTEITTREKQTVRVNKTVFDSSLLPKGYAVVKDPFSVECKDAEIELTLTLPADYKNITVLKCSQGVCAPTVEKVVERTVLSCGGVDTNVIGEKIVGLKEIALDTLTALPSTEKPITITDRIIESGGYKIEFEGTNELKAGIKELSPVKPLGVKDSTFIETPIIIHTESSEKTPLTIILKYKIPEGIVEDSIEIYTKKGQLWTPAGGNVDKEKDVIELKTSTNITDENGDITIGVVGTVCTTCLQSTLKEVYTGSEDDALILVHGVFARSDTFNSLIAEFALLQQPWTIYVYEYNYNDELVKNGEELSAYIQQYSSRHKNIYLAGHSMGGLVVQEALKQGEKQQSSYIEKVRKAILIATPNTGAPAKELYELLDTAVVNQFINASKFYLSNETLELLTTGKNIPRKEGITYEVVAGNTGYNFTTEYFRDPENPEIVMPNDGIITVKSAQTVGGTKVDNLCKDYYEVGLTHTEINDHPIINRIIARSINEEKTSSNTAGFTQYYKLRITSCDKDDKYVVVGKPIRREESYSVLQCGCGNGYCGLDEDAESCPSDCASFFQKNIAGGAIGITTIVGGTIVLIFVIIAPIIYFIGRLVARRKPT